MSKKQKRQVSTSQVSTTAAALESAAARPAAQAAASREFNPDYTYIKQDLKRIGIMALSFFVILVALSFFLN
jgi:energy-coupling factor transporter transmembrane protein EcfT